MGVRVSRVRDKWMSRDHKEREGHAKEKEDEDEEVSGEKHGTSACGWGQTSRE